MSHCTSNAAISWEPNRRIFLNSMLITFGVIAVSIMFLSYWNAQRSKWLILVFAIGCGLTSLYSGLAKVYPITVVEGLWALVALQRFVQRHVKENELSKG